MSTHMLTEEDFRFLPESEAIEPTKGRYFQRMTDIWAVVHPEKGIAFYNPSTRRRPGLGALQGNSDERIAKGVERGLNLTFPHEIKFFDVLWVPLTFEELRGF